MKPLLPEHRPGYASVVFAKNQPEYLQLPANTNGHEVETKWKLSLSERLRVFLTGEVYLTFLTFGQPLQPTRLSVKREPNYDGEIEQCDDSPESLKKAN